MLNQSYQINAIDEDLIKRRFTGQDTSFVRGDWIFEKPIGGDTISVSTGLNDTVVINGSDVTQHFKGLCVGDVNESYLPPIGAKNEEKVLLNYITNAQIDSNEEFILPIILSENLTFRAFSLIFTYSNQLMKIDTVKFNSYYNYKDLYIKYIEMKLEFPGAYQMILLNLISMILYY